MIESQWAHVVDRAKLTYRKHEKERERERLISGMDECESFLPFNVYLTALNVTQKLMFSEGFSY